MQKDYFDKFLNCGYFVDKLNKKSPPPERVSLKCKLKNPSILCTYPGRYPRWYWYPIPSL